MNKMISEDWKTWEKYFGFSLQLWDRTKQSSGDIENLSKSQMFKRVQVHTT